MKEYIVMVTRYGFVTVDATDDEDAIEKAKNTNAANIDWSDEMDADIIELDN